MEQSGKLNVLYYFVLKTNLVISEVRQRNTEECNARRMNGHQPQNTVLLPQLLCLLIFFQKLTITEMNIHVPSGSNALQTEDIFSVVIHVTQNTPNTANIELIHYERITAYAVYDKCKDSGVDGELCVCSLGDSLANHTFSVKNWHKLPQIVFGHMTVVFSLNKCLFIYERRTPHGLALETSCDCLHKGFHVLVQIIKQSNVVTSKTLPMSIEVHPGAMVFVCTFHQLSPLQPWKLDYDVKFRNIDV